VSEFYPEFATWFDRKVCSGVETGSRKVFACLNQDIFLGIAIAKRSNQERKLSTLWVSPHARTQRIALQLANSAFLWMETKRPTFTVPEERIGEFRGLLRTWHFTQVMTAKDLYRKEKLEYVFNSSCTPQRPLEHSLDSTSKF